MGDILHTLERRYGKVEELPLDRIQLKQARNRGRRQAIDDQIAELTEERIRLSAEYARLALSRQTLVEDFADRIRRERNEGWSPQPVLGYRLWGIDGDGTVVGATGAAWTEPTMVATCVRSREDDDLPHTDHHCSRIGYGCGVYAAKNPALLEVGSATRWILGIVLLSGKVVEHETGYRAARAQVAAAVAGADDRWLATGDMGVLDALFARPVATIADFGRARDGVVTRSVWLDMVEQLEREMEPWT